MKKIEFDCSNPKITYDQTQPPFDGKPVLIKLAPGWVEAWWDPPNGEYDGFRWICLDDQFQAEWDEPSHWDILPKEPENLNINTEEARKRKASPGAPRPIERKCFICEKMSLSPDKEPPFRCHECYAAVWANEADGEL